MTKESRDKILKIWVKYRYKIRVRDLQIARLKHKAHEIVSFNIRNKIIKRQKCELCRRMGHAHHPDYNQPLLIKWLCRKHHVLEHMRIRKNIFN